MEWNGPLRQPEIRLDVLKFCHRSDTETLLLTHHQWNNCVNRYSDLLALRPLKFVNYDLAHYAALPRMPVIHYIDSSGDKRTYAPSGEDCSCQEAAAYTEETVSGDVFDIDWDISVLQADTGKPSCARLNHAFVETLHLERRLHPGRSLCFQEDFWAWIKDVQKHCPDVHVGVLQLDSPSFHHYRAMDAVFNLLDELLHAQEYIFWKDGEMYQGDELCADLLKKAKRLSVVSYCLSDDENDDYGENGSVEHVLDFAFDAPQCEELYVSTEHDGRSLPDRFIKRFRELSSTNRMVTTFTWQWKTPTRNAGEMQRCDTRKWPEPIAVEHPAPFQAIAHRNVPRRFEWDRESGDEEMGALGGLRGDVYQFRCDGCRNYLTVVVAQDQNVVQFRNGPLNVVDPTKPGSSSENSSG